ncbi:hypothetical protein [Ilumatobacter coccineus]|uniref:Uncharacterized protein n=1 Tax=Ilumatobacter coccineus (strain NBRC 103263 / KCTC 29153 / YM16-304) TaxID=1313172 RepID=A0A6C7EBH3_ILUCY|nr:hypothetical protein [Ilumatobacter coccineus]BAN03352.1 hypothetical protein YM304_30380 [Ilumatobacter coccineus YM16-304]
MTAPNVLASEQTTENTDTYFTRISEANVPQPVMVLLRNLQTQLTDAEARITALENA